MIDYLLTLLVFYRRHLRVQPMRELMAIVGVAAGVALLFAVQVSHRSITGSFEEIAHGVAGRATLEVAGRSSEGFNERVAEEVEHMPAVKNAAPILQQPIVVAGPKGRRALTLIGATYEVTALGGDLSMQFQRASEGVLHGLLILTEPTARAIGAKPGTELSILVGARTKHLSVGGIVPSSRLGPAAESPVAAASLPITQIVTNLPRRITRILIQSKPGQEAYLRRALTRRFASTLNVRPVNTEAKLLANAAGPEKQITLLFSAISLVAGVILAYNALLLASDERRRFIAYLIEAGTPDSMIIASLVFDAFVLGIAGACIGLLAGDVVSIVAYHTIPGYIAAAFAIGGQRIIGPETILIAFSGGMIAAFTAAILPAITALRWGASAEPNAVGKALSFTRRLHFSDTLTFACGALLICLSILAAMLWPTTSVVALVTLTAGLMICLPLTLRGLVGLADTASQQSSDPSARLSVAELRGSPTRSVALLATGTVAVFLVVLIGGSVADVQRAVRRGANDLLSSANVWIKPGGPENVYTTQTFAYSKTLSDLKRVNGVKSVLPWRDSFLDLPGRRVWVLGVPPQTSAQIAPSQLIEGSLRTADRQIREGGWAALSQTIVREDHLQIGQHFTIPTPTGHASLRLAAVVANYGWLPGAIVMNGEENARLWGSNNATQLAVVLKPGVQLEQGRRAVNDALPQGSALVVQTAGERQAEVSAVLGSTLSRLSDTTFVVLIATIASVIALMIAAIWQQRARLNSLQSIGMDLRQLARLIFYESGSPLLSGAIIGMAAGLVGQYLIDGWLHQTTGSPVRFMPAWQLGLRTVAVVIVISIIASMITVIQASRFQPRATFSTE
jgi:putative ABC transport system permease protein